jgi:hypothetical protein
LADRAVAQDIGPSSPTETRSPNDHNLHNLDNLNQTHFNARGKPCIAMSSYSMPQFVNKKIFEHWIKASNSCGQHIKVQVCYHKTADCVVMTVPPWETKNAILGIQPDLKEFQFDAKEK